MFFIIFVIFNQGVLCQDIGKMSWNFGSFVFFCVVSKKYSPALSLVGNLFFRPTLLDTPLMAVDDSIVLLIWTVLRFYETFLI